MCIFASSKTLCYPVKLQCIWICSNAHFRHYKMTAYSDHYPPIRNISGLTLQKKNLPACMDQITSNHAICNKIKNPHPTLIKHLSLNPSSKSKNTINREMRIYSWILQSNLSHNSMHIFPNSKKEHKWQKTKFKSPTETDNPKKKIKKNECLSVTLIIRRKKRDSPRQSVKPTRWSRLSAVLT